MIELNLSLIIMEDSFMKKYVTKIPGSSHHIYKIGFGTYDILKSGLSSESIKELLTDFVSMGGNVIDTSRYDVGTRKHDVEEGQKIVGEWIRDFNKRQISCIISKSSYLLNYEEGRDNLLKEDLEISLKNLNTDYLDVFLVNGDNEDVDVSNVITQLENLKQEGKILSYGCSNWKPYRIRQAMEFSKQNGFEGFTVNQMLWNIGSKYMNPFREPSLYVKMNNDMLNLHKEYDILAMPYNSLANGIFAKLYISENEPGTIDIESLRENSPYYTKLNLQIYERMKEIGARYLAAPGWVALGYLFNQEIQTCSIVSCRNLNQLREAFEAVDREYTYEDFKDIDLFEKEATLV